MSTPSTSEYVSGSLYRLATVSIWVSWIVAARLGLRTSLTPWDITAIRCGVSGLILLPYLLKVGVPVARLGAFGLAAIVLGGGAPMVLVAYAGLQFAPAAHAASLFLRLSPYSLRYWRLLCLTRPSLLPSRSSCPDCYWCLSHRRWRGRHDRIAPKHRPRPVHRRSHVVGLLYRCNAESAIGWTSHCCYCGGRIIDHFRASVRHRFRDKSVQRAVA